MLFGKLNFSFPLQGSVLVDVTAPTVVITSTESSPTAAATIPITITFSESVTGFVVGDITAAGCTLSDFAGSGAVYTVTATPTLYEVTLDIAADVCVDAANNGNEAATQFAIGSLVFWYLAGAITAANCKAAYQPVGAASLAASYVNLANPGTNNAAPGNAPDWTAGTGWQFVKANLDYLTTGLAPSNQWSIIARFSDLTNPVGDNCTFIGSSSATNFFLAGVKNVTNVRFYYNGTDGVDGGGVISSSGVIAVAGNKGYWNGSQDADLVGDGGNIRPIFIGALNFNSSAGSYTTGYIQAAAIYDITLTGPQVAALTTAMNALP